MTLKLSMEQNEMFILGIENKEVKMAIDRKDYKTISDHLYRVQKLGKSDYTFRHHLETQILDDNNASISKRFYRIRSIGALILLQPYKIRISQLGEILV